MHQESRAEEGNISHDFVGKPVEMTIEKTMTTNIQKINKHFFVTLSYHRNPFLHDYLINITQLCLMHGIIIQQMSGEISLLNEHRTSFKPSRRSTLLENYDPTAYPPDLQFAQEHGRSQAVGKYISPLQDVQRCRCCLEPIHKEPLPLLCNLSELDHCGESTPLYFVFVKQLILLLLFNCLLISVPAVLINFVMGSECKTVDGTAAGILNSVCRGSAINIMSVDEIDSMQIEAIVFFIAILLNIVFIAYLEVRMETEVRIRNANKITAADYSFVIKGLPSDLTIPEIQKYVEDKMMFSGAPDLDIVKIYLIYNFKDYVRLLQTRQELVEKSIELAFTLTQLEEKGLRSKNYEQKLQLQQERTRIDRSLKETEQQLQQTEAEISRFETITHQLTDQLKNQGQLQYENLNKHTLNFSGKCIVTVNNRRSRDVLVEQDRRKSCVHRIAYGLSELLEGRKSKLLISPAPQPSDILFGNMGSRRTVVWKKRIMYSLLISLLILLDFLIVALTKKLLKEQKAIQKGNILFSFLNSMIVSLFCSVFRRIINTSESQSYYTTISKMSYNKVAKMVVIFQVNMLLTTFVANVASFYLIKEDTPTFAVFPLNFESFLFDVFFLIVTNPVITVFMTLFDHRHIRNLIKKYRIRNGGIGVSQAQANVSFQNMNFDICYKYGTMYRFVLFSAGIAILYPLSFFICLIALSALYWVDKYLLLRRYAITIKVSSRFTLLSQNIMNQIPLYLSITNLLVMFIPIQDGSAFKEQKYSKTYYYLSVVGVIVSALNYFGGNAWLKALLRMAFWEEKEREEEEQAKYKDIENTLLIDYSHDYPYFRVGKRIGLDQPAEGVRKEKLKELKENEKLGVFEVLQNFIAYKRYS